MEQEVPRRVDLLREYLADRKADPGSSTAGSPAHHRLGVPTVAEEREAPGTFLIRLGSSPEE